MKIQYPEIAAEIMAMVKLDRAARAIFRINGKWDKRIEINNTRGLRRITKLIGWPTRSKVGKRASHGAWLLVLHSDLARYFQYKCFLLMKCEKPPEVELSHVAHSEDRIRLNFGLGQTYGTQLIEIDGKYLPRPINDPANVSRRRKTMGLDTLRQNIARLNKNFPIKK